MIHGATPAHRIVFVDRDWEKTLIDGLSQNDWQAIRLAGGDTIESFFIAARNTLPLDPPISGKVNWNALSDSFAGGLDAIGANVALLWMDAERLMAGNPQSFAVAVDVLEDVASSLEHERTLNRTKAGLRSFLLGKGPQFQSLDFADLKKPTC